MAYRGKPILGIVGGVGSGKSFVARLLGGLGCAVVDSDAVAHAVYLEPPVVDALVGWYGPGILDADGRVDRRHLAHHVFRDAAHRARLEAIVHPRINAARLREMDRVADDPDVRAFVWDSPLLIEAGLDAQCDAIVFVDAPYAERLRRVMTTRGWDEAELKRREASQRSLDEKRARATHVLDGTLPSDALCERLAALLDAGVRKVR